MASKKCIIASAIIVVIVAGISFYVGTFFGSRSNSGPNFSEFSQNGNRTGFNPSNLNGGARNASAGVNFGEIISIENGQITVKLDNGGSKLLFIQDSTIVSKSVEGNIGDLSKGTNITFQGTNNSDGSITAQSIQIRPSQEQ